MILLYLITYLLIAEIIINKQIKLLKQSGNKMSIYSGFATRHQEESYDQLVEDVIFVLQKRIIKFYNNELADETKFLDVLINLHQQLSKMQQNKYLQPKTSNSIEQLLRFMIKNIVGLDKNPTQTNKLDKHKSQHQTKANNKQTNHISNTTSLLQIKNDSRHPLRRDSSNQPVSIGKIIKQIGSNNNIDPHNDTNSLAQSRNTFINQNKFNAKNVSNSRNKDNPSSRNPQQKQAQPQDHDKINKTEIQYKSRFKNKQSGAETTREPARDKQKQKQTRDFLLQYLEKNNKNYVKGYRKRQVKTRGYSKQYSAHY